MVLVDAGTLSAFAAAARAEALFAWYGPGLHVVRDAVLQLAGSGADPLRGCADRLARERRLVDLSADGKVWVARVEAFLGPRGAGLGRLATIASARMASELTAHGEAVSVVAHDRWARALCARLGVRSVAALDAVDAMTGAGTLTRSDAAAVARALKVA